MPCTLGWGVRENVPKGDGKSTYKSLGCGVPCLLVQLWGSEAAGTPFPLRLGLRGGFKGEVSLDLGPEDGQELGRD